MILVVGSMNLDRIARLATAPGPGETVAIDAISLAAGGKGGNVAAAAARLGARVAIVARVGRDPDGEVLRQALADAGCDTAFVETTDDAPTGTALIWVEAGGENRIGVLAGANATLSPQVVDALCARGRLMQRADRVVLNLEVPLATVRHVVALAHGASVPVLLNLSPIGPMRPEELGAADTLVVNGPEAGHLLGGAAPADLGGAARAAEAIRRSGPGATVVTVGSLGLAAATGDGTYQLKALPVRPVDTTGAGDAFLGALAAALDARLDLDSALRIAAAAGAFTATRPGAQTAQPSWPELLAWTAGQKFPLPDLASALGRVGCATDGAPPPRPGA